MCCLQETNFRPKDTYRLKVRGWKNIFHANGKQKKAGVAILISKTAAAAAAAKSLQSCPTLCDPIDGSPRAPPSLGFSRQEYWSRLPFLSPMHESEK